MTPKVYKSMFRRVQPSPELVESTIRLMSEVRLERQVSRGLRRWHPALVTAAVLLCLAVATPALAARVPAIYDLMHLVSPSVAQRFAPVQISCEDNGIVMEVVSACVRGNVAEVYVSMRDVIGGRIDETTDLFDSYSIARSFDSSATCERVGYDAETNTVTFLITITELGGRNIVGKKITFSVREFLSQKTTFEDIPIDVSLSPNEPARTHEVSITGWSGAPDQKAPRRGTTLAPSDSISEPIPGFDITAIGYIDDKLHVQLATTEALSYDYHGDLYLVGEGGSRLRCSHGMHFQGKSQDRQRVDYQEFVFDISPSEAHPYTLHGSFFTSGLRTEGNWRVTFPLTAD